MDIIDGILDVAVGNYTNYGKKPTVVIKGKDELEFMEPGHIGIIIVDGRENPTFLADGTKIFTSVNQRTCRVILREGKIATLEKLQADVESLFTSDSTYSIQFDSQGWVFNRPVYELSMTVKLL